MDDWQNYYDVVLLPNPRLEAQTIQLSHQLYELGSRWQLDRHARIPHLSLLHIPVRPSRFNDFLVEVTRACVRSEIGKLKINGIHVRRMHRAVFLMADKPLWLRKLYFEVIRAGLPYRDQHYAVHRRWGFLTPGMRHNVLRYGTPMVGRYFEPHVTLGTFETDGAMDRAVKRLEAVRTYRFIPQRAAICRLGPGFTCSAPVADIRLS